MLGEFPCKGCARPKLQRERRGLRAIGDRQRSFAAEVGVESMSTSGTVGDRGRSRDARLGAALLAGKRRRSRGLWQRQRRGRARRQPVRLHRHRPRSRASPIPSRCLERFESSKAGHLGLGLCMARRIASRFGGDLAIGKPDVRRAGQPARAHRRHSRGTKVES